MNPVRSTEDRSWKAEPWMGRHGGHHAATIQPSCDRQQVHDMLVKLERTRQTASAGSGSRRDSSAEPSRAAFLVVFQPALHGQCAFGQSGYARPGTALARILSGVIRDRRRRFRRGPHRAHRDLGVVTCGSIAPTIAKMLHVAMPTGEATPLTLRLEQEREQGSKKRCGADAHVAPSFPRPRGNEKIEKNGTEQRAAVRFTGPPPTPYASPNPCFKRSCTHAGAEAREAYGQTLKEVVPPGGLGSRWTRATAELKIGTANGELAVEPVVHAAA